MKNRISKSIKILRAHLKEKIIFLNNNAPFFSKEHFIVFKKIILKSYSNGFISESEFMELTSIVGKDINHLNKFGFIEKSIVQTFCDIANNQL